MILFPVGIFSGQFELMFQIARPPVRLDRARCAERLIRLLSDSIRTPDYNAVCPNACVAGCIGPYYLRSRTEPVFS